MPFFLHFTWYSPLRAFFQGVGDTEKCRDVYERAISFVPKAAEKVYWARYIYLWIMYALYEELEEEVHTWSISCVVFKASVRQEFC